jgi:hypothetical protein
MAAVKALQNNADPANATTQIRKNAARTGSFAGTIKNANREAAVHLAKNSAEVVPATIRTPISAAQTPARDAQRDTTV